ncbi:hypothetical protein C8Q80DRAFT_667854 [Daedaleopsis nitida]|nr:hypothetical protein C8Q80DRAFT_667854 [Daedaleopsis nitida]
MVVTLFSVLVFILSLLEKKNKDNWWYIALEVVGSKLYVNIVLAMINLPQHHCIFATERASLGISLAGRPSLQLSTWFAAAKGAEDRRSSRVLEARSPQTGIEINVTHEFVQEISEPEPMSRSNSITDEDIVVFIA